MANIRGVVKFGDEGSYSTFRLTTSMWMKRLGIAGVCASAAEATTAANRPARTTILIADMLCLAGGGVKSARVGRLTVYSSRLIACGCDEVTLS